MKKTDCSNERGKQYGNVRSEVRIEQLRCQYYFPLPYRNNRASIVKAVFQTAQYSLIAQNMKHVERILFILLASEQRRGILMNLSLSEHL